MFSKKKSSSIKFLKLTLQKGIFKGKNMSIVKRKANMEANNIKTTENACIIKVMNSYFMIFNDGSIKRYMKSNKWKLIKNTPNHHSGMNVILIEKNQFTRSKLLGLVYFNLDINKSYITVYKDKNRINCNVNNLQFIEISGRDSLGKYINGVLK